MVQDNFIPVATNARSRNDLVERGFSRQPLRIDTDVARSLEELSNCRAIAKCPVHYIVSTTRNSALPLNMRA
jgi:hypothetical protein